jgi:hypothetical protein
VRRACRVNSPAGEAMAHWSQLSPQDTGLDKNRGHPLFAAPNSQTVGVQDLSDFLNTNENTSSFSSKQTMRVHNLPSSNLRMPRSA